MELRITVTLIVNGLSHQTCNTYSICKPEFRKIEQQFRILLFGIYLFGNLKKKKKTQENLLVKEAEITYIHPLIKIQFLIGDYIVYFV